MLYLWQHQHLIPNNIILTMWNKGIAKAEVISTNIPIIYAKITSTNTLQMLSTTKQMTRDTEMIDI